VKLTVFNGSPRGRKSNTRILLEYLVGGVRAGADPEVEIELHYLSGRQHRDAQREAFARADFVLLAFPLYVHAMPGLVKELLEVLEPRDPADGVRLAFLVQQGFPETHQSHWLTPYLARLPARLGCTPAGIAVKGGVEGIQIRPPWTNRKLFSACGDLGRDLAATGRFDPARLKAFAQPVRLGLGLRLVLDLLIRTGLANYIWDRNLKKYGVYDQRFARPYDP
jgi:NADPH-dependent FMN reductase